MSSMFFDCDRCVYSMVFNYTQLSHACSAYVSLEMHDWLLLFCTVHQFKIVTVKMVTSLYQYYITGISQLLFVQVNSVHCSTA